MDDTLSMDILVVKNPLPEDFKFSWDKKPYTIPAGGSKPFVKFLAEYAAHKIAKRILGARNVRLLTSEVAIAVEVQKLLSEVVLEGSKDSRDSSQKFKDYNDSLDNNKEIQDQIQKDIETVPSDDDVAKDAIKNSSESGAKLIELKELKRQALLTEAAKLGLETDLRMTKDELVDAIMEKLYPNAKV